MVENHYKLPFWDPLEHKRKVNPKPCCNDFRQVTVLKELVDGTFERDFTKATNSSVWSWFFIKKVHQDVLKYFLLKCTTNRDVFKRTRLTGTFIQHLTHFWLGFLRLFLGEECKIELPIIYFDRDMLQPQKVTNI